MAQSASDGAIGGWWGTSLRVMGGCPLTHRVGVLVEYRAALRFEFRLQLIALTVVVLNPPSLRLDSTFPGVHV